MRALPLLLLLGACVSDGAAREPRETRDGAQLARDLATRTAGEPQACISVPDGPGSLQGIDRRTLTVRRGATLWVNRLAADCPGLEPFNTIIVEVHGGQYCRGDHIRTLRPPETIPGPVCFLGDFTPYRASAR